MQKLPTVNFPGVEKANENMLAVAQGQRAKPFYYDLDLTNARSLALGTQVNLPIAGNMFYIDANPNDGNATVHFQDQALSIASVPFYVGPSFMTRIPYTQIAIENAAQPGKKIRIIYGIDLDFVPGINSQVTATINGIVVTADPVLSRALAGQTFIMPSVGAAKNATNFNQCQLFNPANSGVNVYLKKYSVNTDTAGSVGVYGSNAILPTAVGNPFTGNSKKLPVSISKAAAYSGIAPNPNTNGNSNSRNDAVPAGVTVFDITSAPYCLTPGTGIIIAHWTVNSSLNVVFETEEI